LHFVGDQQDAVLGADFSQALHARAEQAPPLRKKNGNRRGNGKFKNPMRKYGALIG
jgi:hypothetical protein